MKFLIAITALLSTICTSAAELPTGKFTYTAKGYAGDMVIKATSACTIHPNQLGCMSQQVFTASIETVEKSSGNDRVLEMVENAAARMSNGSQLITDWESTDKDSPASFSITFNGKQAIIHDGDIQSGCGMSGNVLGRWIKK